MKFEFRPILILHHFLITGLIIMLICIAVGGIIFLYHNSMEPYLSHGLNFKDTDSIPGATLMKLGLYLLLSLQLLRVFAVLIHFLFEKNWPFAFYSLFVLAVLFGSLLFATLSL